MKHTYSLNEAHLHLANYGYTMAMAMAMAMANYGYLWLHKREHVETPRMRLIMRNIRSIKTHQLKVTIIGTITATYTPANTVYVLHNFTS